MTEIKEIDFAKIEKKWQVAWEKGKVFEVKEDSKKKKYYVLEMFPYPSAYGLHMGHALNYTIGDILARFKRMSGFNVLYPMGYDALGLPAENAAIKAGEHPADYTNQSIKNFVKQQKALGLSYDWSRMLSTANPDYYKWDQWIFLKMFEKGIAFRKKAPVNWCPKCKSVLANEQVHSGKCWRHGDTEVGIKHLEQWFLKITDYANELYEKIDSLEKWPERIKAMQKNWIGKSYGTEIDFEIGSEKWPIFTTRPDTIYGVTFMVVAAQHSKLDSLVTKEQRKDVDKFLKKLKSVSEKDAGDLEKEGVFTGSYAINPATNEKIPIWAANFVIADYGSGMVMADAHDQRDLEFAQKYKINLIETILPIDGKSRNPNKSKRAFTGYGILTKSGEFNGLESKEAIVKITDWLIEKKSGRRVTNFKLRNWLISRQRYWGTPIPIIYCDKCGAVPVPEKDLPVELPKNVKFGKGNPLEGAESWIKVKCPKCGGNAQRETDTMDTFVNSSWYYLRYCDSKNNKKIFDSKKADYWCPVDQYIGGAEHACMHLIYFRFYTKFLNDLGLIKFREPVVGLFNQGMLHGEDGNKMSKSLGNAVDPLGIIKKYGADSLRMFLISVASPDSNFNWDSKGIVGMNNFLKKLVSGFNKINVSKSSKKIESKLNKAIKEITYDIENFKYNLAIIKIRTLTEVFISEGIVGKEDLKKYINLISVFAPHIAEELWEKIGGKGFVSLAEWPICYESKIDEELEKQEDAVEKLIGDIRNILKILEGKGEASKEIKIFAIPKEVELYKKAEERISGIFSLPVCVLSISEAGKTGKKIKAVPGKPGVLVG